MITGQTDSGKSYLTGLAALVAGGLRELLNLRFRKFIEGLLHASPDQFLDLPLDYFLVELSNITGYGLSSPFECLCSNFILPETGKPCLLFCHIQLAQLIVPYLYLICECGTFTVLPQ